VSRQAIRQCLQNHRIGGIAGIAFAFSGRLDDQIKRETNTDTALDSLDLVFAIGVERDVFGGLLQLRLTKIKPAGSTLFPDKQ
jgi:hypothetical protein